MRVGGMRIHGGVDVMLSLRCQGEELYMFIQSRH